MALIYQANGLLAPGIHELDWTQLVHEFGYNPRRVDLVAGLKLALADLQSVGCKRVYINGSFVSRKADPGDFDACWEHAGVDLPKLKKDFPLFFDFADGRANQKKHYKGELMPARAIARISPPMLYFDFFQLDKDDKPKGIVGFYL